MKLATLLINIDHHVQEQPYADQSLYTSLVQRFVLVLQILAQLMSSLQCRLASLIRCQLQPFHQPDHLQGQRHNNRDKDHKSTQEYTWYQKTQEVTEHDLLLW